MSRRYAAGARNASGSHGASRLLEGSGPTVAGGARGVPPRQPAGCEPEMKDIDHLESWEAANISIGDYIDGFYNPQRRHSALNYNSPIEFELIHSLKKKAA